MREWEDAIRDLNDSQIEQAVKKCKYTCEFINISTFRKAALGVISASRAYEDRETNPLARRAWGDMDDWYKTHESEDNVRKRFMSVYDNLVEQILVGDEYD